MVWANPVDMWMKPVARKIAERLDAELLDGNGRLKLLPTAEYRSRWGVGRDRDELRIWCTLRARYCLPTIELIDFLRKEIGYLSAIEIGSGQGDLCHHLGIQGTDSAIQQTPEVKGYYEMLGQAPTNPPPFVERIGAMEAIAKYSPQVVLGAWITHKHEEGMEVGNVFGPDEREILAAVPCYIHIGNLAVHASKPIIAQPHAMLQPDCLVSRASRPELDRVWIWER